MESGLVTCVPIVDKVYNVKGGNQLLVRRLVEASKTSVRFNTTVTRVERRRFGRGHRQIYNAAILYSMQANLSRMINDSDTSSIYHKHWFSYPLITPDNFNTNGRGHTMLSAAAWYVNAMEPLVSTMETETISAKNIAFQIHWWFDAINANLH